MSISSPLIHSSVHPTQLHLIGPPKQLLLLRPVTSRSAANGTDLLNHLTGIPATLTLLASLSPWFVGHGALPGSLLFSGCSISVSSADPALSALLLMDSLRLDPRSSPHPIDSPLPISSTLGLNYHSAERDLLISYQFQIHVFE